MKVYLNAIKFNRSLVDGPGVRTVVFFQGCDIHCEGCQNPSTWDMKKGVEMETKDLADILKREVINNKVTISGGEPLMQYDALLELVKMLPDFNIAVYTGHEFSEIPKELLDNINYIKTGRFDKSCRTTVKPYVGSQNQEFRKVK